AIRSVNGAYRIMCARRGPMFEHCAFRGEQRLEERPRIERPAWSIRGPPDCTARRTQEVLVHRVWKVAAILFALSTALLWMHPRRLDAPVGPRAEAWRPGAGLAQRIAASRADLAEDALLDALRASDDTAQIVRLPAAARWRGARRSPCSAR